MSEQQTAAIEQPTTAAPAEAGGEQVGQAAPQATQAPDPVLQRLDQMTGELRQFAEQVQTLQQPQDNPYANGPQYDPYTGQPLGGPAEQYVDFSDPQQVQQYIQDQVQNGVQQAISPVQADLYQRDVQQVFQEHPEIRDDPQVQQSVLANLREMGHDPNTAVPPSALRAAYRLHKADQFAKTQTPLGDQQAPALETGGGAVPQQPEISEADAYFGPRKTGPANVFGIR